MDDQCHSAPTQGNVGLPPRLLTAGQDKARSIVTDDVLLQRLPAQHLADDKAADMRTDIRAVTDEAEATRISELFERFREQARLFNAGGTLELSPICHTCAGK